jgi:hypothetical protein
MSFDMSASCVACGIDAELKLSRIEKTAFQKTRVKSIHIPASAEIICQELDEMCTTLASVMMDRE